MKLSHLPPDTTNGVKVGNSVPSLLVWIYPLKMTYIFQCWINLEVFFLKKGCFLCGEERLQLHINIGITLFLIASEKYFKIVNMIIQVITSWMEMWISIELSI